MPYAFSKDNMNKHKEQLYTKIGQMLEQGDFQYFLTKQDGNPIDKGTFARLLSFTSKTDEIKKCIKHRDTMGFGPWNLVDLIKGLEDPNYTKECINKKDEFKFGIYHLTNLIQSTNDLQYIKDCIDKKEEFKFDSDCIISLIKKVNDLELENNNSTNKNNNSDYIIDCIENRTKELGLRQRDIIGLIKEVNNIEYIKKCIFNKRKELNLKTLDILEILIRKNNLDLIKDCINQSKQLGINGKNLKIINMIYEKDKLINKNTKLNINLPPEMTIGIEIEAIGEYKYKELLEDVIKHFVDNWSCKEDGSVYSETVRGVSGIEIVSPILRGSNKKNINEIIKVCAVLDKFGFYTNETCGGHIHIGDNYLDNANAWQNLLEMWSNTERILYIISNEKGNGPRKTVEDFAEPVSKDLAKELNKGSINIDSEMDLKRFKEELLNFQGIANIYRYKSINFQNIKRNGKGTIEFRISNGTVNTDTWIENINLFGGIVKSAKELSVIQSKDESKLSEEEKEKLKCFENIKSDNLNEKEKLESILVLVVKEPDRHIYRKRYIINKRLSKQNKEFQEMIRNKTSRKSIKIQKNKIAKNVFSGSDGVTAEEVNTVGQIIDRTLATQENSID